MANSLSTSDCLKKALYLADENTDGTSPYQQLALSAIQQMHLDLVTGSSMVDVDVGTAWTWARAKNPISLILQPVYSTGTVAVTNGSPLGVFSVPPLLSMEGRYVKFNERRDYFKVLSHAAGSPNFTFDAPYTQASGALAFRAIPLIYDLGSDIQRLVAPIQVYRDQDYCIQGQVDSLDINTMMARYPVMGVRCEMPEYFAVEYQNEDSFLIRFSAYVSEQTKIDIPYIPIPDDLTDSQDSIPLMPRPHRVVLEYFATHTVLVKKGDQKAAYYLDLTKGAIKSMQKVQDRQLSQTNPRRGQLIARQDQLRRFRSKYLLTSLP